MRELGGAALVERMREWLGARWVFEEDAALYARSLGAVLAASAGTPTSVHEHLGSTLADELFLEIRHTVDAIARGWLMPEADRDLGWVTVAAEGEADEPGDTGEFWSARMAPRTDVNVATAGELEALPRLGPTTAARLVARRRTRGPLTALDELGEVGLSTADREALAAHLVFRAPPPYRLVCATTEGAAGLASYLEHQEHHRLHPPDLVLHAGTAPTARGLVRHAMRRLVAQIHRDRYWARDRRMSVAFTDRRVEATNRRASLVEHPLEGVVVLRNFAYLDAVLRRIEAARERVWVEMFFLTTPGDDSPGVRLLDACARGRDRGVDVRLILDDDLPSDYHGASRVNRAAFERVRELALPMRRDWLGRTTHAKAFVLDSTWVCVGAHNWTASAMFQQDETSLLIRSPAMNAELADRFDALWRMYAEVDPTIRLDLLRFPHHREVDALRELGLEDTRALLDEASTYNGAVGLAARAGVPEARFVRLWRIARLMTALRIPEATALALTFTAFDAPSEVERAEPTDVLGELEALPPLPKPFTWTPIRFDLVRAALGVTDA
jgi:hypothetical protein